MSRFLDKPEPKTLVTPSGKLQTTNLSLKKLMTPEKEAEGQSISINQADLPREYFTVDDVKMQWRILAQQMKSKGRETVYNALQKRDALIVDTTQFILEVDNHVQVDIIRGVHDDLLSFLRQNLRNYDVQLEVRVTADVNQEQEVKHLSGNDKFKHLARKHPNLHTLKSVFGLDIEY